MVTLATGVNPGVIWELKLRSREHGDKISTSTFIITYLDDRCRLIRGFSILIPVTPGLHLWLHAFAASAALSGYLILDIQRKN